MPTTTPRITPFLWFEGEAEEAAKFYTEIFPNSKIEKVVRNTESAPGPTGGVLMVEFTLEGQPLTALNGRPSSIPFTEAMSFVVHCGTQQDVDYYWDRLLSGGTPLECGWLKDRYGVPWQIVPDILPELLGGPDRAKADRAMAAMMKMVKLDVEGIKKAAEQA